MIVVIVFYLVSSIKILVEYERGVIFRLGRVRSEPTVFVPLDRVVRVSLRVEAMEVPAQVELDELLSRREKLNMKLQTALDRHTGPWGVKVDLPEQMIRAIARQAEAERERRAAETTVRQPVAIQLRYLQTLVEIGSEKNTTVVFPLPMDILTTVGRLLDKLAGPVPAAS